MQATFQRTRAFGNAVLQAQDPRTFRLPDPQTGAEQKLIEQVAQAMSVFLNESRVREC